MRRSIGLCLALATAVCLVLPASAGAAVGAFLISQHSTIHATAGACAGGPCDSETSDDGSDAIGDWDGSVSAHANVTGAFGFGEAQQDSKVAEGDGSISVTTESDIDFSVGGSASEKSVSGTASSVLNVEFKVVGNPVTYFVTGSFEEPVDTAERESLVELKCDSTTLVQVSSDTQQNFSEAGTIGPGATCLLKVDGHGSTTDAANSDGGLNLGFGAKPLAEPIIFVHGFVGSKIFCGAQELWPNLPKPRLPAMNLERDGRTNAGCASAGPSPGQLFETALGSDVYKSTIDFLRSASDHVHLYAWDWRKSPEEAVAGLDALVNQVRPPGGKVVLMAHSAGGLVVRSYVEDPARAAKVSRALTVATPYWGSPKSLFPFLYGVESPGISTLDPLLDNEEFKDFARYLQGMFFLWPSASYGGWLSIEGEPSPLKTKALLDFVEDQGGNRSLLATALGAHAARLDQLRTNGIDYQTVVGSGLHTIGAVEIKDTPLLSRDLVEVDWVNGDGTVPLTSARAATPAVRQHFVCGVSHVPLPGNPTLDLRVRDFLLEGEPVNDAFPVSGSLCEPEGFALSIFSLPGAAFPSSAASAGASAASSALSFDQAEQSGLIEAVNTGSQIEAATSTKAPLALALKTKGAALRIAPMKDGKKGKARIYGPLKSGELTIELGPSVTVRLNGKKQKGRPDDTRRPKTRVTVRKNRKRATLRFRVSDTSPTTTYVKVGKRIRKVGKTLKLPAARLRKGVTVQSIDAFGNAEKPKKIRS